MSAAFWRDKFESWCGHFERLAQVPSEKKLIISEIKKKEDL